MINHAEQESTEMEVSGLPPPPSVRGRPILGSALELFRDPVTFLLEQHRRHGPIFAVKAGYLDYVVMVGLEANRFVQESGSRYLSASRFWKPFLDEIEAPHSIVGLEGEDHSALRRLLAPGMSKRVAEDRIPDLVRITREALKSKKPGEDIRFVHFAQLLVSRQVGFLMTGETPTLEQHAAILRYLNTVSMNLSLRRLPRLVLKLQGRAFSRAKDTSFRFADALVESRRKRPFAGGESFIDLILAGLQRLPHLFDPGDIRAAGLLPFFAGVDTVGQTLCFALWEILRRPTLLRQLREEVAPAFASGAPTAKGLREMSLLQGVVLETLRLHPTAFGMSRTATDAFPFASHRVEKGQDVLVFTTACHLMEEYFPRPERFEPDRCQSPRNEHQQLNVYSPFGRGPHSCLGSSLALVQLATTLATIVHDFDLELSDPDRQYQKVLMPTPSLGDAFEVRLNGRRNKSEGTALGRDR